jgi:N-acetylmuramic acid 6-phosphate etherase
VYFAFAFAVALALALALALAFAFLVVIPEGDLRLPSHHPKPRTVISTGATRALCELRSGEIRFSTANIRQPQTQATPQPHNARIMEPMNLSTLLTESRNPLTEHIDELPTLEMLSLISDEDRKAVEAVAATLPDIAKAVDEIARRFQDGGRLFYIGAGTSGRLGVLDASEIPPTFSVPPTLVQGLIAGGDSALRKSSESSEDSAEQGAADLAAAGFTGQDALVGIAASGRTPYVLGALQHANPLGAITIALTCVPNSPMSTLADITIAPITGPEVLTGSTRMKAGTATKLVLNMLSTGVMIKTGAVYGNLMINVQPTNAKLIDRAQRIIIAATGLNGPEAQPTAEALLKKAGSVKTAIVMQKLSLDRPTAEAKLAAHHGNLSALLHHKT